MLIVDNVKLSMTAGEGVGADEAAATGESFESCEALSGRASTASIPVGGEVGVGAGVEAE
jgi:hypothetical protein